MDHQEQKMEQKVENKVMSEIKSGRVKLRSKYVFLAEKLGVGSALTLTVLLAVLFFNLAFFYLKASDNLRYLSFGSRGLFAFLESFPYLLVAIVIILIFLAGFIIKKSGISYKKPFGYVALGLIAFIILTGVALDVAHIAEKIERASYGSHPTGRFFGFFLSHDWAPRHAGLAGRVVEVGTDYVKIQTPFSLVQVDLSHLQTPIKDRLSLGSFIITIGEKKENIFVAHEVRLLNENDVPMISHGVRHRFGPPPPNFFSPRPH